MVKNEIAKINPKNNDTKCFQSAIRIALNHKNIVKDWQKRNKSKIKPFVNQYHWKEINLPSHKNDWKKVRKLNILCLLYISEERVHAYISKHNTKNIKIK